MPAYDKWYKHLSATLRPLAKESLTLLKREQANPGKFDNYDFVAFPLAKAFEVFLKDYLYAHQLIDNRTYNSKKFSIGRALNPDVRLEQRDGYWYYDDLAKICGEAVAGEVWDTWLRRNRLMHLYPGEEQDTTLEQAEALIQQMIKVISLCAVCDN